jgi:hypothetical protein
MSRGSSVSIVSDHGLDDQVIGVRSPAGKKDFSSSLCVQTGSGAHPASCTEGTGGPFPGVKRGRGVMLTTHPYLVPWSRMSRSFTFYLPWRLHGGSGTSLTQENGWLTHGVVKSQEPCGDSHASGLRTVASDWKIDNIVAV